ncbi:unannotated protein [freshwater metagenome]|uniref:Unannotated protein n=1 Tax=freshwater metagenome TaxID=449393 RepID=A0A6J6NUI4_9ZZZZ
MLMEERNRLLGFAARQVAPRDRSDCLVYPRPRTRRVIRHDCAVREPCQVEPLSICIRLSADLGDDLIKKPQIINPEQAGRWATRPNIPGVCDPLGKNRQKAILGNRLAPTRSAQHPTAINTESVKGHHYWQLFGGLKVFGGNSQILALDQPHLDHMINHVYCRRLVSAPRWWLLQC